MSDEPETILDYPFGAANRLDLDPLYAELQRDRPLVRVRMPHGGDAWLATSYDTVKQVLADLRFSRAAAAAPDAPRLSPEVPPQSAIVSLDPPEHTRVRRLVAAAFTNSRIEALRPRVEEIVASLLDEMERVGPPVDLLASFSLRLPLTVICEMLGVPLDDHHHFRRFSAALVTRDVPREEVAQAREALEGYLWDLIRRRRAAPGNDLLSALIQARVETEKLGDEELINLAVALLVGGHESTATHLTSSVYVLLENPDQLALLMADPSLIASTVEELLRFVPVGVGGGFMRSAKEDVEIGGVTVRKGEAVLPAMIAANLDPAAFENAGQLDVARSPNAHLGFGHGAHHCLGSQLARLQLQTAIQRLFERFPTLRLAVADDELPWKPNLVQRGFTALPVAW